MRKNIYLITIIYIICSMCMCMPIAVMAKEDNNVNDAYFNNLLLTDVDNADPFIIKEDDTYYLYSTGTRKGIYYSITKNYKEWSEKKIAFENPNNNLYKTFWAPEVYSYKNKYYLLVTAVKQTGTKELIMAISDDLNTKFEYLKRIDVGFNNVIDGNILFDNGHIYLYFKNEEDGNKSIYGIELNEQFDKKNENTEANKLIAPQDSIKFENGMLEGPFCIKYNNEYYLMYSTGSFTSHTYCVGYAKSTEPINNFQKITIDEPLLKGMVPEGNIYNSDKNIYGTGHNMILKISDNELYIIYHSAVFENNVYKRRKLNIDRIGFDSNGMMYVNGPSTIDQPLPSGTDEYYQLTNKFYSITADQDTSVICDEINYLSKNTKVDTVSTKNLEVILNKRMDVSDVWLFGTESGFCDSNIDVYVNNELSMSDINLGTNSFYKLTIPANSEHIKNIKITSNDRLTLSEVKIVTKTKATYEEKKEPLTTDKDKDNNEKETIQYVKKDDTIAKGILPQTGTKIRISLIIALIIITLYSIIKVYKNSDI